MEVHLTPADPNLLELDPRRYTLTQEQLELLAIEHCARVLDTATVGDEDDIMTIEFADTPLTHAVWDDHLKRWAKEETKTRVTAAQARAQFDLALIPFRKRSPV